jgi:hypothetical protein
MKRSDAEQLIALIQKLADAAPTVGWPAAKPGESVPVRPLVGDSPDLKMRPADNGQPSPAAVDFEVLYQKIKRRLLDDLKVDPVFVKLLATQPEIMVEIEPRVVEMEGSSLKGRIARLMAAGFFKDSKKSGTVRGELARTGSDPGSGGRLSEALSEYVLQGFLTREGDGYTLAPGVKVSEKVLEVV